MTAIKQGSFLFKYRKWFYVSFGKTTCARLVKFPGVPLNYRPQRSWAKVMFLQVCVILFTGGVSASVHAGIPHPPEQTPQEHTPPGSRHPPRNQTPPGLSTPPGTKYTPHWEADSGIQSMSSRYASYWNAFLFTYSQYYPYF